MGADGPADSIDLCRLGARRSMRSVSFSIAHVTLGRAAWPAVTGRRGLWCSMRAVGEC